MDDEIIVYGIWLVVAAGLWVANWFLLHKAQNGKLTYLINLCMMFAYYFILSFWGIIADHDMEIYLAIASTVASLHTLGLFLFSVTFKIVKKVEQKQYA